MGVQLVGVHEIAPMQERVDSGKNLMDLMWMDTDNTMEPAHFQDEEARQSPKSITSFSVIILQCHHLKL